LKAVLVGTRHFHHNLFQSPSFDEVLVLGLIFLVPQQQVEEVITFNDGMANSRCDPLGSRRVLILCQSA
jgi:hypothetical protein